MLKFTSCLKTTADAISERMRQNLACLTRMQQKQGGNQNGKCTTECDTSSISQQIKLTKKATGLEGLCVRNLK